MLRLLTVICAPALALTLLIQTSHATYHRIDLAQVPTDSGELMRVHGSNGNGAFGVPVAGGKDCDGDGWPDYAFAAMLASPLTRDRAGQIHVVFGDGRSDGVIDTAVSQPRILEIFGSSRQENAGNEMWIDDVTGDGIADLLIGRQNFSFTPALVGDGALSIIVGGPELRTLASAGTAIDLRQPPETITVLQLIGGQRTGRLGMYMRSGDITGDGIADLVIGADQEDHIGQPHSGAVYVIRGGAHLAVNQLVDLGNLPGSPLAGHVGRIDAGADQPHLHFGSTVQTGDLDNDGKSEVMISAALNRAGGVLSPFGAGSASSDGIGGTLHGTLFILWDENFPSGLWPEDFHFRFDQSPAARTRIDGGERNAKFGEEMLGGSDYDADGHADLFVGDLTTDLSPTLTRPDSGAGYVFYDAVRLKGLSFSLDQIPAETRVTVMTGEIRGAITGDTAIDGDFDGDGIADLAVGSPHAAPLERQDAGVVHILFGQAGGWPASIDVSRLADAEGMRSADIIGARGRIERNDGDVLAYSVAVGDVNGDGRSDLIVNEMEGDGLSAKAADVGNLLVISGRLVGTGLDLLECPRQPLTTCASATSSRLRLGHGIVSRHHRLRWIWRGDTEFPSTDDGAPLPSSMFSLCVYGGDTATRIAALELDRPNLCNGCWATPARRVWRYRDVTPVGAGNRRASFRGGDASSPRRRDTIDLRARYWPGPTTAAALTLPVTLQLIAGDSAPTACWQAAFSAPAVNGDFEFSSSFP